MIRRPKESRNHKRHKSQLDIQSQKKRKFKVVKSITWRKGKRRVMIYLSFNTIRQRESKTS